MAQRFLAPEVVFEGLIKQNGTVSDDAHLITRGYLHGNVINGIHPDSANYASVVSDGGVDKLKIDPLTITSVTVNASETSLANFVSNVYTGSNFQEGDIVFLTATSPTEAYIHNGGTAGTAADWELVNSGLSDAQIRSKLSASAGIDYNSSTGEFTADQAEIKAFFSAGTGLAYSNGQFSLNATSDQITEGSNNLFYSDSLVDGYLAAGQGLAYSAGVFSLDANTDDIAQLTGATNKFYADSLVDAHLSGGTGITYNAGQISFSGDTGDVAEGSNLYYTDSRSRNALSVATLTNDIQLMQYNATTGQMAVPLSLVFGQFSAGQGLSWDGGGEFSLDANTDDIAELTGATNKWYTTARVQADVGVSSNTDELINYSAGEFSLRLSDLRKEFNNQSLTANTALTLTHNLGKQLVYVSAMDSNNEQIDLKVVFVSSTQVAVTSTINLTGIDIAVRI
jgi:hypothetical protein